MNVTVELKLGWVEGPGFPDAEYSFVDKGHIGCELATIHKYPHYTYYSCNMYNGRAVISSFKAPTIKKAKCLIEEAVRRRFEIIAGAEEERVRIKKEREDAKEKSGKRDRSKKGKKQVDNWTNV